MMLPKNVFSGEEGEQYWNIQVISCMQEWAESVASLDSPTIDADDEPLMFTRREIVCWLARSMLHGDVGDCNLKRFVETFNTATTPIQLEKLKGLMNYFVEMYVRREDDAFLAERLIVFLHSDQNPPDWRERHEVIEADDVTLPEDNLDGHVRYENETSTQAIAEIAFSNRHVCGGVLGRGSAQEEILMVIRPELLMAKLLMDGIALDDDEAMCIIGSVRFNAYEGYGTSAQWMGRAKGLDDVSAVHDDAIVFVDAKMFAVANDPAQLSYIDRELMKFNAGLGALDDAWTMWKQREGTTQQKDRPLRLITGRWGCGVFNGTPLVKAIIQVIVAKVWRMKVDYLDANKQMRDYISGLLSHEASVATLYDSLNRLSGRECIGGYVGCLKKSTRLDTRAIYEFIMYNISIN